MFLSPARTRSTVISGSHSSAAVGLDRMTSKDFEKLKAELGLSEGKRKPSQDDQVRVVAYEMV